MKTNHPAFSWTAITACLVMLAVSVLPNALWHELGGGDAGWLFWAKVGLLAAAVVAAFLWSALRPLRGYFLALLGMYAFEDLIGRLTASTLWQSWFNWNGAPFTVTMLGEQIGRVLVSLLMIALLLVMGYRRKDFFLMRGDFKAPIRPVRWLGFPKADPWTRFGGQFALYISLGLLVFLILGGRPDPAVLPRVLPMLPMILLLAGMNAFSEEMTYRASLLATLEGPLGPQLALWNTALFFGIGHYFGVPYGVVGVILASFLGWLLGKSMLETRGMGWAWFIHILQDILIFSFMALGSIHPGG
jgi:membrane protease YdiL (CAAX protease family)